MSRVPPECSAGAGPSSLIQSRHQVEENRTMQMRAIIWSTAMAGVVAGSVLIAAGQSRKEPPTPWKPPPFKPVTKVEAMMEGQDLTFDNIKAAIKAGKWGDARHG